jgi:endoglucanase
LPGATEDGTGGWHDAGDYNKYVTNGATGLVPMLMAWHNYKPVLEGMHLTLDPAMDTALPDYLDALRWEIDWIIKMQRPDGQVCYKLSTAQFGAFIMPEDETTTRFFTLPGPQAASALVGLCASMARAVQPYDMAYYAKLTSTAKVSWDYLLTNPADTRVDCTHTGPYPSDERGYKAYAAAEWWETTGDPAALAVFEGIMATFIGSTAWPTYVPTPSPYIDWRNPSWDYGSLETPGVLTYLASTRPGRRLVQGLADILVGYAGTQHSSALNFGSSSWGINGEVARASLLLDAADCLAPKPAYRNDVQLRLDYFYGCNASNRSQVTGEGLNPPLHPHHRPSGSPSYVALPPWPGLLVGGPISTIDRVEDYVHNEVAVNWSGALIYALAMSQAGALNPPRTPSPTPTISPTFSITGTRTPSYTKSMSFTASPWQSRTARGLP